MTLKTLRDGSTTKDPRLDRLVRFDEASREWNVRSTLLRSTPPRAKSFRPGRHTLNQRRLGGCVGWSNGHGLNGSPDRRKPQLTDDDCRELYFAIQRRDQWDGGEYPGATPVMSGTAILDGMLELRDRGEIDSFYWIGAGSQTPVADAWDVLTKIGGIQLGIPWLESMFEPRPSGKLEVDFSSGEAGGHAIWALTGRLTTLTGEGGKRRRYAVLHQTWGSDWGVEFYGLGGFCYLDLDDLGLLLERDGEGAVPLAR